MNNVPSVVPPFIVPSANVVTPAVSEPAQTALQPNKSESNTADGDKSNRKSTVSATAKLFLRGVRDSADAFGPLKSVAGGLCFILENCEVSPLSHMDYPQHSRVFQRTKANRQAIESLAPRVKALSASLCTPVSEGGVKERERRKKLER